METALAVARQDQDMVGGAMSVRELRGQVNLIQEAMKECMQDGTHYGLIPGCGDKPALLKAGAEKLCFLFRLAARFELSERVEDSGHYTVGIKCTLHHISSGVFIAEGLGMCSSHESKYAFRKLERKCPSCGKDAIIKGQEQYGGGWICWKKKDGCGAKFFEGDPAIESQQMGRVSNPDLPDQYNTVLKMAQKRALVAATLIGTAASDIFTQDIEDMAPADVQARPAAAAAAPTKGKMATGPAPGPAPAQSAKEPPVKDREMIVRLRGYNVRLKEYGLKWSSFLKGDPHQMTDEQIAAIMDKMEMSITDAFLSKQENQLPEAHDSARQPGDELAEVSR